MLIESGKPLCKSVLIIEISNVVLLLNADMQEVHIEYMADYVLKHYASYTISDLTALTARLVKNNPYGKPILQNLIYELDQYSIEKQEFAVQERMKENSLHKADHFECDKFYKNYQDMKRKAKEPVKSQKQKDREAFEENERRKEMLGIDEDELERLYPKH